MARALANERLPRNLWRKMNLALQFPTCRNAPRAMGYSQRLTYHR